MKSKSIILVFTLQLKIIQLCSLEKRKEKKESAHDPNDQSCVQFPSLKSRNDITNAVCSIVLFCVTCSLHLGFCVVASSAEDHGPDREANHLGEAPGSHGDC